MADASRDLGSITRFKGSNFHLWKFQMRAILLGKELMDIVEGTLLKPADTEAANVKSEWVKRNSQAFSLLCQALDESILKHVVSCTNSKEIWDKLKLIHERNTSENIHTLQEEFYKCAMTEGESVADFLSRLDYIVSQLASRGDTTFNEKAQISKILCNLPSAFDSMLPAWRMQPDASKTLSNLILQLLQTEGMNKMQSDATIASAQAYAASAKGKNPSEYSIEQRAARKKEIADRKKITECWKCGKTGHWGKECQASEEEHRKHQESKRKTVEQNGSSKTGNLKAYMAHSGDVLHYSPSWYVDSGCTEHMAEDRTFFTTYRDLTNSRPVKGIGGLQLQAVGVGDILIKIQLTEGFTFGVLKDVLYVPKLGRNLFSSYAAAQKKIFTLHTDVGCHMLENGKKVMIGVIQDRMYRLLIEVIHQESQPTVLAMTSAASFGVPTQAEGRQSLEIGIGGFLILATRQSR